MYSAKLEGFCYIFHPIHYIVGVDLCVMLDNPYPII